MQEYYVLCCFFIATWPGISTCWILLQSKHTADFRWTWRTSSWVCTVHFLPGHLMPRVTLRVPSWHCYMPGLWAGGTTGCQISTSGFSAQMTLTWQEAEADHGVASPTQTTHDLTEIFKWKMNWKTDTLWCIVTFCFNGWSAGFKRFSKI